MKRKLLISALFFGLATSIIAGPGKDTADPSKINVKEDAYTQGGETAKEMLGSSQDQKLKVGNVMKNNKYSRRTYLKFSMKNIEGLSSASGVVLHVYGKAFSKQDGATASVEVNVVETNKWNEGSISWDKSPTVSHKVGSIEVKQGEWQWYEVYIPAIEVRALVEESGKKAEFTVALQITSGAPATAEFYSKERKSKNGKVTKNQAYITLN